LPDRDFRNAARLRLAKAYAVGALGYFFGLIASIVLDLPTGAIIVGVMAVVGIAFSAVERGRPSAAAA
jgi:zinc/manganese transport system permease protein